LTRAGQLERGTRNVEGDRPAPPLPVIGRGNFHPSEIGRGHSRLTAAAAARLLAAFLTDAKLLAVLDHCLPRLTTAIGQDALALTLP
jgi:hypothetical protein